MRRKLAVIPGLAVLVAVLAAPPALAAASAPPVVPPSTVIAGLSYSQWSAQWWQWAFETPWKGADGRRSLLVAPDGAVDCSFGQTNSHVWFLGGTFIDDAPGGQQAAFVASRRCTVPAGIRLFFPVVNAEQDNVALVGSQPTTYWNDKLRQLATHQMNPVRGMAAWIDGHEVPGLSNTSKTPYRVVSPLFQYSVPSRTNSLYAANHQDVKAGPIPWPGARADGAFLMVNPLCPGVHHLHWVGGIPGPTGFKQDITYTITVPRS